MSMAKARHLLRKCPMKFNILFKLRGPAGQMTVPCSTNPVEADSWKSLFEQTASFIDSLNRDIKAVGVVIEQVEE